MIKYEKRMEATLVIADIICDICGNSCNEKSTSLFEYSRLFADWGYGSKKDGLRWNGHFCEECSNKIKGFIESLGGKVEEKNEH